VRRQRGRVRQQRGDAAVACGVRRATHQTQWKTQGSQSLSDSVTLSQRHSVIGSPNFTQLHGVHAAKFTATSPSSRQLHGLLHGDFTRFTAATPRPARRGRAEAHCGATPCDGRSAAVVAAVLISTSTGNPKRAHRPCAQASW
jgi:hypothetical protein